MSKVTAKEGTSAKGSPSPNNSATKPDRSPEHAAGNAALTPVSVFAKARDALFRSRPWRAYNRYSNIRSNLLAGGIAYTALFSLAGIVTLLIMSVRVALNALPVEANALYRAVNKWLPGAIQVDGEAGVIDPAMISSPGFTWGTAVAFGVSFVAGLRVVSALRITIQESFGLPPRAWAVWKEPVRDFLMFFVLGTGMIVSLVVSTGSVVTLQSFADFLPFQVLPPRWLINFLVLVLTSGITACLVVLSLRYLALVRAPRRDLWLGSGGFAVATTFLQMFGAYFATNLSPLVAPFAVLFTLILWVNILSRMFLYACCWIANPPLAPAPEKDSSHFKERPNYVTLSAPATLNWPHDPISGQAWSVHQEQLANEHAEKILESESKTELDAQTQTFVKNLTGVDSLDSPSDSSSKPNSDQEQTDEDHDG